MNTCVIYSLNKDQSLFFLEYPVDTSVVHSEVGGPDGGFSSCTLSNQGIIWNPYTGTTCSGADQSNAGSAGLLIPPSYGTSVSR